MALESLRIFRPAIFTQLQKMKPTLTALSDRYDRDDTKQKTEVEVLVESAGGDREYIKYLIKRIFPAANQYIDNTHYGHDYVTDWRRQHRVAHIDFLRLYFERTAPSELSAFRRAETAYELMSDETKLGEYLDALKPGELEDVIAALEVYEHAFTPDKIVPGAVALLNRIYAIPERDIRGMFDIGRPDITVGRVVLRMLRRVEDVTERERMVTEIMPKLDAYSTRLDFIHLVGYKEGVGHKLISQAAASELEASLLSDIIARPTPVPDKEWDLLRVYLFVKQEQGEGYKPATLMRPAEIRSLFRAGRSVMQSQSFGTRAVHVEEHLAWDILVGIVGSEDAIRKARKILHKVDGDSPLIGLVDKYLDGWRPSRD
jgi:hypothetical protein